MSDEANEQVDQFIRVAGRCQWCGSRLGALFAALMCSKNRLRERVIKAKWLLGHDESARCLERMESLRRYTGWIGARNPLGRVIHYLRCCSRYLVNYQQCRAQGL